MLLKLAFISALVFEISQLQSAQDRVVLTRTNATIVRGEHYELVAMQDPGPKIASLDGRSTPAQTVWIFRLYDLAQSVTRIVS